MRGLVLSGGGDKGAYQAGVCYQLARSGHKYDIFLGSSVGALNAAFLAQYENFQRGSDALYVFWSAVTKKDVYKRSFFGVLKGLLSTGISNTKPLEKTILEHISETRIQESGNQLRILAVDLVTGEADVFDQSSRGLERWILASASFPVIFPCVLDGEQVYTDGGVIDATPLGEAIKAGCTSVDVVLTGPYHNIKHTFSSEIKTSLDVARRVIEVASNQLWQDDLKLCHLTNELVNLGESDKRWVDVQIYAPHSQLASSTLGFKQPEMHNMINQGILSKGVSLADFIGAPHRKFFKK